MNKVELLAALKDVKDYEEKTEVSKALIQMAMIRLMLKQLAN